jgi:hypothetical protein
VRSNAKKEMKKLFYMGEKQYIEDKKVAKSKGWQK